MFKFSRNRRGIPFFADFYASNLLWNKSSSLHNIFMEEFLNYTRKVLIENVAYCVINELGHLETHSNGRWDNYFPNNIEEVCYHNKDFFGMRYENRVWWIKRREYAHRQEVFRKNGGKKQFFNYAYAAFNEPEWRTYYGGSAWAEICKRTQSLIEFVGGLGEFSVKIDMVIDSAHNTGRCLDKLYGGEIVDFLDRKTRGVNSQWLIELAQPVIRKLRVL